MPFNLPEPDGFVVPAAREHLDPADRWPRCDRPDRCSVANQRVHGCQRYWSLPLLLLAGRACEVGRLRGFLPDVDGAVGAAGHDPHATLAHAAAADRRHRCEPESEPARGGGPSFPWAGCRNVMWSGWHMETQRDGEAQTDGEGQMERDIARVSSRERHPDGRT